MVLQHTVDNLRFMVYDWARIGWFGRFTSHHITSSLHHDNRHHPPLISIEERGMCIWLAIWRYGDDRTLLNRERTRIHSSFTQQLINLNVIYVCMYCLGGGGTDLIGMCEIAAAELDSWAGQSTKWLALCQKEGAPPDPSLGEIQIAIRWEQQSYDA